MTKSNTVRDILESAIAAVDLSIPTAEEDINKYVRLLATLINNEVIGHNLNTHWSACNNHGIGKPNYKCVCPAEPQNYLREQQRNKLKTLLGDDNA